MEPKGISRIRCLILTLAVVSLAIPAIGSAIPPLDAGGVKTEKATAKKAVKKARVCTPAQARAKAKGKRVNCVVKPRVCTAAQAKAKAKGKRVNCVVKPRVCTAAQAKAKAKGKKVNCVTRKKTVAKKAAAKKVVKTAPVVTSSAPAPSAERLAAPVAPTGSLGLVTQLVASPGVPMLAAATCSGTGVLLNFEGGDGDTAAGADCLDWLNVASTLITDDQTDAAGQPCLRGPNCVDQTTFGTATKVDDPIQTIITNGQTPGDPNNKSDLEKAYVYGDWPLFAVGVVTDTGGGSTNFALELNQQAYTEDTPTNEINRQNGDLLFLWTYQGNSTTATLTRYTWLNGAWTNPTVLDATAAVGASNTTAVQDPETGRMIEAGSFNEIALNMNKVFTLPEGQCIDFGTAMIRSITGFDLTSQMKDTLSPIPLNIANCEPQIVKSVRSITTADGHAFPVTTPQQPVPASSTVAYDVAVSLKPGSDPISQSVINVTDSSTSGGLTNQSLVVLEKTGGDQDALLEAGETWYYGLPGSPPVRVSQVADECSLDNTARLTLNGVALDPVPTSTVTTPVQCGTLVIKKVTDPATTPSSVKFGFTPGGGLPAGDFELGNGETKTYSDLLGGTSYSVAETDVVANWSLVSASCVDGQGNTVGGTLSGQNLTGIEVTANGTTTCTFTNRRDQAAFRIKKTYEGPANLGPATYRVDYECKIGDTVVASGYRDVAPNSTTGDITVDTTATCTITEVAPDPVTGHTWTTTYPTRSVTIATGTTPTAEVKNVLTRDVGSLSIVKTLQNPDGATVQATFSVTYTCTMQGQDTITGTVNVAAGTPTSVPNIPTGYSCSISEATPTPVPGHTWDAPTYSPQSIVVNEKGGTFTLGVTNRITRDKGSLSIVKTLQNPDGATVQATFSVTYTCTMDGQDTITGTVNVADGTPTSVPNIPTGYSCSISEATPTPVPGYTWDAPTYSPRSIVVSTKGGTFTLGVTNRITRDLGSLKIEKTLSNPDQATVPTSFSVTYTCTMEGQRTITGTVSVGTDSPQTVTGIPTGYSCSVEETLPAAPTGYTWADPTYSPESIVVGTKGQTFTITVGNSITRDMGSLSIVKTLQNPDGATVQATFSVTYTCTMQGQDTITGTVNVGAGAPTSVPNIPTGYSCSIEETLPTPVDGYTWDAPTYSPQSIAVSARGGTFTLGVTNRITRDMGSLSIVKTLQNPDDADVQATFSVTYTCTMDGQDTISGTVNVAAGTPTSVPDIPTGYSCSISEAAPTPVADHTWDAPTYSPRSIVVSTKGETFTLGVTNRITRDRGSLRIEKTLSNPDGATVQATFSVTYTCKMDGQPTLSDTVNVGTTSPQTISGIPTGYSCSVTEATPTPVPGYTWAVPTYSPQSVDITERGQTLSITVSNAIAREMGSLVLSKTLTGGPTGYTGPFAIGYTCRLDGSPNLTGSFDLASGATSEPVQIPSGYICSADETLPAAPDGYTFGTPQIGAPVTIANGAQSEITVANTLTRDTGSLVIAKTLAGGPAGYTGPFTVHYSCTLGESTVTGTREVPAGGSATIEGIPTGYVCSVTETLPGAPAGYEFAPVTITPAGPVTITKGAASEVTVANRLLFVDVAIEKTAAAPTYQVGQTITYYMKVTNTGQTVIPVASIQVTDPDAVGLVLEQPAPQSIAPGESIRFTGTRVVTAAMAGQTVPNTATVTTPNDGNPDNNTSTTTVVVEVPAEIGGTPAPAPAPTPPPAAPPAPPAPQPKAVLSIDKTGPKSGMVGTDLRYQIVVRNTSTTVARNVVVNDVIPGGMSLVGRPTTTVTAARVAQLTRALATARVQARRAPSSRRAAANARVRSLTRALATARARDAAARRAQPNQIRVTIRRGVVRWTVGDMKPGQTVTLTLTLRAGGTRAVTRCNVANAVGSNADRVVDRQCTALRAVLGQRKAPVVTG